MKKSLLLGIIGLAAGVATSYGQGFILLDNYSSYGPYVTYGANVPANGVSGALGSGGLNGSWTVGLYFAVGNLSLSDPMGTGTPIAPLALGTGTGSTIATYSSAFNFPGAFQSGAGFNTGAAPGVITAELVAYDTADGTYANAAYRVHSIPFTMPTVSIIAPAPSTMGQAMIVAGITTLTVAPVPEPTTMALAGLGGLGLLLFRRKQV